MLSHRPFIYQPTMFRSLPFFLALSATAYALTPPYDGDIFITTTVTSTHYVCPCESTSLWSSRLSTSKTGATTWSSTYTTTSYSNSSTTSTSTSRSSTTITSFSGNGTSTTTSSSSSSTSSAVPSFYFGAYGNGFVTDGTSLGDDTTVQYAALNNANTAFIVNSTGALIDPANGRVAVVDRTATNPIIMFISQAQFDAQSPSAYVACNCAIATSYLSCSCNGLTAFAAGADTYLHIQAPAGAKRDLAPRQGASSVSISATPVGGSTTTVSSSTTTTSSCPTPASTFVIVANGSTTPNVADGTFLVGRVLGAPYTNNASIHSFTNSSDPWLYSLDPCTGYLRETRYSNVATRSNATGRYNNIIFNPINATQIICKGTINSNNGLSLDCTGGYNKMITDANGNLNIGNNLANETTGDYPVYPIVRYTSTVPTFPTYTPAACPTLAPTFNVISNGSTYSSRLTNGSSPYGTFMYQGELPGEPNKTAGYFGNDTTAGTYTIDCAGVWTERSSGRNQILNVVNINQTSIMRWSDPGTVKPGYNAKVCKCSIDGTTNYINCDCGYGRTLFALFSDRNWIFSYAPGQAEASDGYSYIQPIARLLS